MGFIVSIWKEKGDHQDWKKYRGNTLFNVPRKVLANLLLMACNGKGNSVTVCPAGPTGLRERGSDTTGTRVICSPLIR